MFGKDIVEGITILNRHDLGWAHRINVDELDMRSPETDLLYLLYRETGRTYSNIIHDYANSETYCGFGILDAEDTDPRWGILTREWQRTIHRIQENIPADKPFEATLGSLWEREE